MISIVQQFLTDCKTSAPHTLFTNGTLIAAKADDSISILAQGQTNDFYIIPVDQHGEYIGVVINNEPMIIIIIHADDIEYADELAAVCFEYDRIECEIITSFGSNNT